jgi:rhodanese-related sulfurtransferase
MQHLTVEELAVWLADSSRPAPLLLDVREGWEYETCHIQGSLLIPMSSIPARQEELDPEGAHRLYLPSWRTQYASRRIFRARRI